MVAAAAPSPSLRTVADRVNDAPVSRLLSFTEGDCTSRSGLVGGGGADTVTDTALEQLFVVSDSPVTASTHAP